jgi:hypothetical protein
MMPRRRDCAKSVIESRSDLNRVKSWAFALWSVTGLRMPLLGLVSLAFEWWICEKMT